MSNFTRRNDMQLAQQLSVILRAHNDINRLARDDELEALWQLLADVHHASKLAMFRINDLLR